MGWTDVLSRVRHLDNLFARWLLRHFYFLFFQIILIIIAFIFLYEALRTLEQLSNISSPTVLESLVGQHNLLVLIIVALMILNSFWMLFMFNILERLRVLLKDISYQLMRRKI